MIINKGLSTTLWAQSVPQGTVQYPRTSNGGQLPHLNLNE